MNPGNKHVYGGVLFGHHEQGQSIKTVLAMEEIAEANQATEQKAEEALESFSLDKDQVISLLQEDLNFFAATVFPTVFTLFYPALHLQLWNLLIEKIKICESGVKTFAEKFPQIAVGWPRGHAKTTLIKLFICWLVLFSSRRFILIVSSNATKAEQILSDVCDMLLEENIRTIFGDWRTLKQIDRSDLKVFTFLGRDIVIAALGSGGDPRGFNLKNKRPDVILMDDIQTKECSDSPQQSKVLISWLTSTLMKAKDSHSCPFVYIGNMFKSPGCILKTLRDSKSWTSFIVAGILADGTALWPELRSKEDLLEELKNDLQLGTPEAFFAEIMNDPTPRISAVFDLTKIPPNKFSSSSNIATGAYIIIDVSGDAVDSDDTTIILYKVYDGIPVAEKLLAGRFSPGKTICQALILALENNAPLIACEAVGYQKSLLYWFEKTAFKHGIAGISFVSVKPGGRNKNTRIMTMFKALLDEDLYLADEVREPVFWQASKFDPSIRKQGDDILDNLAYARDIIENEEYYAMIQLPVSVDFREMQEAKVLEHNTPF